MPYPQRWDRDSQDAKDPEDTPVKTRQQPGYESVGIRAGSWMFNPSLTLGGFYDSNVFASNTAKRGDLALVVQPSLRASSVWDRYAVDLQGDVRSITYRDNSGLDQTDASLKARGRVDIRHDIAILTSVQVAHLNETVGSLSSPAAAVQPTPYDLFAGDITYRQEFNRLTASLGARFASYDYGITRAQDGSIIRQDNRDGQIYTAHGRLDYAVSPLLGLFTSLELNRRDVRGTPTQSASSDGFRALSGVAIEFTHTISGEIAAGYSRQRFDDPTIVSGEGPMYRATVTWSPTRLIDVNFQATSLVTQTTETDANSIRATAMQLGVDYEFRRNIVFSVAGSYETDDFLGQIRKDRVYGSQAEVKYLVSRYGFISLRHRYIRRDSNVPSSNYDKHEVGLNVTAQF